MPSIVPSGPSQDVFLVLDQFGERLGRAWRETDENDTDYETIIRHLLEGQCNNPVRVVAFNTDEGWSRDVSDDVADELRERCAQRGEVPRACGCGGAGAPCPVCNRQDDDAIPEMPEGFVVDIKRDEG
jgi:hypothetical protein